MTLLMRNETECYGYIFFSDGHGAFDPSGQVDFTKEQVNAHNTALSKAEIDGMDQNCQVGQWGTAYYDEKKKEMHTWNGDVIAKVFYATKTTVHFTRPGKQFIGYRQKNADCMNFKRVK